MIPYFILLFAIVIATLFDGNRIGKPIFFILVTWMFIFSAYRVGGTGTGDYDTYLRLYSFIDDFEQVIAPRIHAEIGFRILSFLGNYWGFEEQYIIIAMATLSLLPVAYVIYKYSPYKSLSLLILMPYFLTMNMHSSRTSVAAAFGLIFLLLFYHRKWFWSILFLVISASFHSSALILILVFFARLNLKNILLMLFLIFPMMIVVSPFDFLLMLFNSFGLERFSSFLTLYIASEDYGYPMAIYDPRILLGLFIVLMIFVLRKEIAKKFPMYHFKVYLFGTLLMIIFSSVSIMAWRVSYFFILISIIVIPYIAQIINSNIFKRTGINRIGSVSFVLIYVLYTIPLIMTAQPYEFLG